MQVCILLLPHDRRPRARRTSSDRERRSGDDLVGEDNAICLHILRQRILTLGIISFNCYEKFRPYSQAANSTRPFQSERNVRPGQKWQALGPM